jgi:hypothetical protein
VPSECALEGGNTTWHGHAQEGAQNETKCGVGTGHMLRYVRSVPGTEHVYPTAMPTATLQAASTCDLVSVHLEVGGGGAWLGCTDSPA